MAHCRQNLKEMKNFTELIWCFICGLVILMFLLVVSRILPEWSFCIAFVAVSGMLLFVAEYCYWKDNKNK